MGAVLWSPAFVTVSLMTAQTLDAKATSAATLPRVGGAAWIGRARDSLLGDSDLEHPISTATATNMHWPKNGATRRVARSGGRLANGGCEFLRRNAQ
jgi:hypothetical protein